MATHEVQYVMLGPFAKFTTGGRAIPRGNTDAVAGTLTSLHEVPRSLRASRHGYPGRWVANKWTAFSSAVDVSGMVNGCLEGSAIRHVVLISCDC